MDAAAVIDASGPTITNDAGEPCPSAEILHPGTETRPVDSAVPFMGRGRDATCAPIRNARLVWTDNFNGATIGTGENFT